MPVYVALLRAINLGGKRTIRMADLRAMVEEAGGRDVETYIASGNVVFSHPSRSPGPLLAATIARRAGFDVPVMIRSAAEMKAVVANDPFASAPREHVHVVFLASRPRRGSVAIDEAAFLPERFAIVGRECYLALPNGMAGSKLAIALSRTGPAIDGTVRNWRTVAALVALVERR